MKRINSELPRLLFVTDNFGGGTGIHLSSVANQLLKKKLRTEIIILEAANDSDNYDVPIVNCTRPNRFIFFPFTVLRTLIFIFKNIRRSKPDILHSYFFWSIMWSRMMKLFGLVPYLIENREDLGFNLTPWAYFLLRITNKLPDRVICISNAVRQVTMNKEGINQNKLAVIYNGINFNKQDTLNDHTDLKIKYEIKNEEYIVGMVANYNRKIKGVRYFIEAMPLILKKIPNVRFFIIGKGNDEDKLELVNLAEVLGVTDKIVFTGFQKDTAKFYKIMDVSVLTPLSEGLSLTLIESSRYGVPIVATDVGGIKEVVQDGVNGFLVPPKDPNTFAEKVVCLLKNSNLRREMSEAGPKIVKEKFDINNTVKKYQDVYKQILNI